MQPDPADREGEGRPPTAAPTVTVQMILDALYKVRTGYGLNVRAVKKLHSLPTLRYVLGFFDAPKDVDTGIAMRDRLDAFIVGCDALEASQQAILVAILNLDTDALRHKFKLTQRRDDFFENELRLGPRKRVTEEEAAFTILADRLHRQHPLGP